MIQYSFTIRFFVQIKFILNVFWQCVVIKISMIQSGTLAPFFLDDIRIANHCYIRLNYLI